MPLPFLKIERVKKADVARVVTVVNKQRSINRCLKKLDKLLLVWINDSMFSPDNIVSEGMYD